MNTKLKTALLFLFFFASASAFAQYGYPYSNDGAGVDRSIDRQKYAPRTKNKNKQPEKDIVQITVEYLDKRLNLDDFQAAAITTIYNDNRAELMAISMDKAPTDVRKDQMRKITEEIDSKVMELLSEDQITEYKKMVSERKN